MKLYLIRRFNLIVLILGLGFIHVYGNAHAQSISLHEKDIKLSDLFLKLRAQSSYDFFYDEKVLAGIEPISIDIEKASLEDALESIFKGLPLTYSIDNKVVVVVSKPKPEHRGVPEKAKATQQTVRGTVIDAETQQSLAGVTVLVKGTTRGTSTNENGVYILSDVSPGQVITFSIMGYTPQDVTVGTQQTINVSLNMVSDVLEEMVVVGYGRQQKRNLTGSVTSL